MAKSSDNHDFQLAGNSSELSEFITPTDEAKAIARPDNIDQFYVESEYHEAEGEQRELYKANGEEEATPADTRAASLSHEAKHATDLSAEATRLAIEESKRYGVARDILTPHIRRPPGVKTLYWIRYALIIGGDVAGISGAALLLGEKPINAFMQAFSAATSAVTLGAVGREVRYMVSARARQKKPDELTDDEKRYAQLFNGPHKGERLVKILIASCGTGIALIAGGIFTLRGATEGAAAAIAFGCFALGLGLASMYNAFDAADEVAETLDHHIGQKHKAEKHATTLSKAPAIGQHAAAVKEAELIRTHNHALGEAAAAGLRRLCQKILNTSAGVAGNGTRVKKSAAARTDAADKASAANETNGNGTSNGHVEKDQIKPPRQKRS